MDSSMESKTIVSNITYLLYHNNTLVILELLYLHTNCSTSKILLAKFTLS